MNPNEVYEKYKDKFVGRIEDMTIDQVREIFKDSQSAELPEIKVLPYMGVEKEEVSYSSQELSALCPMTAIADTYYLNIFYVPDKVVPELKSLRFYILGYRNLPILHENLLAKIKKDFIDAVKPLSVEVVLNAAVRGGISTEVRG